MKISDGTVSPTDALKAACAGLKSAETSVASAKQEMKAARKKRKAAKELERLAKKRLRRAKKELREAKRVLALAESTRPRPAPRRSLQPLEPAKTETRAIAPRHTVRAKKKTPRKRAIPALTRNSSGRFTIAPLPMETNSTSAVTPIADQPPTLAPDEAAAKA